MENGLFVQQLYGVTETAFTFTNARLNINGLQRAANFPLSLNAFIDEEKEVVRAFIHRECRNDIDVIDAAGSTLTISSCSMSV